MARRGGEGEATDLWLDATASAAGLLMAGVVYVQRLPASTEFLSPRRWGAGLLSAAARLAGRPWAMSTLSWLAVGACVVCVVLFLRIVARRVTRDAAVFKKTSLGDVALRAAAGLFGVVLLSVLARSAVARWVDIVTNAWFMPESLHALEPLLLAGLFVGVFTSSLRAAAAFAPWALAGFKREAARGWLAPAARVAAAALLGIALSFARYDAGAPDLAAALGGEPLVERAALAAVFAGDDGGPQSKVLSVALAEGELEALEGYLDARPRSVFTRAALRRLYTACALRMDASCLRRALSRGSAAGDPYARLLLLDHLQSAAAAQDARLVLEELGDERRWRIGAKAAARLARAWSRQGDAPAAQAWLARASQGEGALPPGLVEAPASAGPLKPGRISGRLRARGKAVVGLYARAYETQPALLGPRQLAASAVVGKDGRFRFDGVPAGVYYLAVSLTPEREFEPGRVRALGRRGDLVLSRRRPFIDGVDLELRD